MSDQTLTLGDAIRALYDTDPDRPVYSFEAVEPSATDADLVDRVLRALDGAS
jgi:hypothetical protein